MSRFTIISASIRVGAGEDVKRLQEPRLKSKAGKTCLNVRDRKVYITCDHEVGEYTLPGDSKTRSIQFVVNDFKGEIPGKGMSGFLASVVRTKDGEELPSYYGDFQKPVTFCVRRRRNDLAGNFPRLSRRVSDETIWSEKDIEDETGRYCSRHGKKDCCSPHKVDPVEEIVLGSKPKPKHTRGGRRTQKVLVPKPVMRKALKDAKKYTYKYMVRKCRILKENVSFENVRWEELRNPKKTQINKIIKAAKGPFSHYDINMLQSKRQFNVRCLICSRDGTIEAFTFI